MTLRELRREEMPTILAWRHQARETLRTPYLLTEEMQMKWYQDVICNRHSTTRYFGICDGHLIGYGGVENICFESGTAEMSLLIAPQERGKGYGREAVRMILREAFDNMRLESVYGECYKCACPDFWLKMRPTHHVWIPMRKYWDGKMWPSLYFTFIKGRYEDIMRDPSEGYKSKDTGKEHEVFLGTPCYRAESRPCASAFLRSGGGIE